METLEMSRKERRRLEVLGRVKRRELTLAKASTLVELSYRQMKRVYGRFLSEGDRGLVHRLRGRSSNRRRDAAKERAVELYRTQYADFGPTLAAEYLAREDGIEVAVETLRQWLLAAGLWQRRRRSRPHRCRRPRKEHCGELVQMDGSHHDGHFYLWPTALQKRVAIPAQGEYPLLPFIWAHGKTARRIPRRVTHGGECSTRPRNGEEGDEGISANGEGSVCTPRGWGAQLSASVNFAGKRSPSMPFQGRDRRPRRGTTRDRAPRWPFVAKLRVELLEDRTLLDAGALADFSALQLDPNSYDPHSLLVRYRPEALTVAAQTEVFAGAYLQDAVDLVPGLWEVRLDEGVDVLTALAAFQADPDVLYAELNYRVYVSIFPNDPQFSQLYGLHNTGQTGGTPDADIDSPESWDVFTGSGSTIVAVIDTGVDYTHPDLAANIWTNVGEVNGTPGVDDDGNGFIDDVHGFDFANNDGDPMDDHGHGTHVSGTIGAVGNNAIGVTGVAWTTRIMGVKFLGANGSGTLQGAINALNYAVANGATISNNSWGGGGFTQALYDAIQNAGAQGHLFVAAAGNSGLDTDISPEYPGSYDLDNIISVAATDRSDNKAGFSNFGKITVDLGAPGVDILSTLPGNQYGTLSGTSMATPHVTGVAALVRDLNPTWTFQQVKDVILATADPINSLLGRTVTGGRLNAFGAITGTPPPDNSGPRVVATSPSGGVNPPVASLRVTFSETIDLSSFDVSDIVSFTGPNGSIAVTAVQVVAGSNDRAFDIQFAQQTALGSYAMVIGPDVRDLSGNQMNQDNDLVNGETPDDRYQATFNISQVMILCSTDTPLPIFDFGSTSSYINVDQHVTVTDLDVQVNISHTFDGDLTVYLISPNGTLIMLSGNRGSGGDDFRDTIFDDEAATFIGNGSPPFLGSFRPETPLSDVDGEDAFGLWQFIVDDTAFLDEGTLNSWCLMIQPGNPLPPPSGSPPVAVNDVAATAEDTAVVINVLANDSDPDGDPLTVIAASDGAMGRVVINADNTVTYIPDPDQNGNDFFDYTITDGNGNQASAQVQVTITAVNDAPLAIDDSAVGRMNVPLTFASNPPALELNDIDPDGDFLFVSQVGNAVHGTVVLNEDGTVTFTPEADYVGLASFEYTVTDGSLSDVGFVQINFQNIVYFSTTAGGTVVNSNGTSLNIGDEDIVRLIHDAAGYRFSLYFDGSDVGLSQGSEDVDAFAIFGDGTIFISTVGNFSVPGPGGTTITGGGEDLLAFTPTRLGSSTAGTWRLYFDGSDVGLDANSERIDALGIQFDGTLILSTSGSVSVPGVNGLDEDLLAFRPSSVGENTFGTWSFYFDGGDVGLADGDAEDVDALFLDVSGFDFTLPTLHFSTRDTFDVPGLTGGNDDIFTFHPDTLGSNTTGSYASNLTFRGALYGLGTFDLDGIYLGLAPFDTTSLSLPPSSGGGGGGSLSLSTSGRGLNGPAVVELFRGLAPLDPPVDELVGDTPSSPVTGTLPGDAPTGKNTPAGGSTTELRRVPPERLPGNATFPLRIDDWAHLMPPEDALSLELV